MAAIQFYGYQTFYYLDYIDLATGKTLVAAPGQSYNVMPAAGRNVPATPTDGRFTQGGRQSDEAPKKEPETIPALEPYPSLSAAIGRRVPEEATSTTSEVKE